MVTEVSHSASGSSFGFQNSYSPAKAIECPSDGIIR